MIGPSISKGTVKAQQWRKRNSPPAVSVQTPEDPGPQALEVQAKGGVNERLWQWTTIRQQQENDRYRNCWTQER